MEIQAHRKGKWSNRENSDFNIFLLGKKNWRKQSEGPGSRKQTCSLKEASLCADKSCLLQITIPTLLMLIHTTSDGLGFHTSQNKAMMEDRPEGQSNEGVQNERNNRDEWGWNMKSECSGKHAHKSRQCGREISTGMKNMQEMIKDMHIGRRTHSMCEQSTHSAKLHVPHPL